MKRLLRHTLLPSFFDVAGAWPRPAHLCMCVHAFFRCKALRAQSRESRRVQSSGTCPTCSHASACRLAQPVPEIAASSQPASNSFPVRSAQAAAAVAAVVPPGPSVSAPLTSPDLDGLQQHRTCPAAVAATNVAATGPSVAGGVVSAFADATDAAISEPVGIRAEIADHSRGEYTPGRPEAGTSGTHDGTVPRIRDVSAPVTRAVAATVGGALEHRWTGASSDPSQGSVGSTVGGESPMFAPASAASAALGVADMGNRDGSRGPGRPEEVPTPLAPLTQQSEAREGVVLTDSGALVTLQKQVRAAVSRGGSAMFIFTLICVYFASLIEKGAKVPRTGRSWTKLVLQVESTFVYLAVRFPPSNFNFHCKCNDAHSYFNRLPTLAGRLRDTPVLLMTRVSVKGYNKHVGVELNM